MFFTEKGFEKRAELFSKGKATKLFGNVGNQLFNKMNISGIFLLLFFPNGSENDQVCFEWHV